MTNTTENARDLLESLTDEYISRKGNELILLRRGVITKEKFMEDAGEYILSRFCGDEPLKDALIKEFEEYIKEYNDEERKQIDELVSYRHNAGV